MNHIASRPLTSTSLAPTSRRTIQKWRSELGKPSWMKWQRMEFQRRSIDAHVAFGAERMTRSEINPSYKQRAQTCSPSFTPTEIALRTISADFTSWRLISDGSHGPSSQNEHGQKSEVKVRERSLPKSMEQSSLRKKTPNVGHTMNFCTKPAPLRPTQQISQLKTSTGKMAFWFIAGRSSDLSASQPA